jgi:hypothetical protein
LRSVGPILGSGTPPAALPRLRHHQDFKLFDKTRLRLYQVSIQIHLQISPKNLIKTEEN